MFGDLRPVYLLFTLDVQGLREAYSQQKGRFCGKTKQEPRRAPVFTVMGEERLPLAADAVRVDAQ